MKNVRLWCGAVFAGGLLAAAQPAQAGPLEDGVAAYNHGDVAAALKLWRPLAEQGLAEAEVDIGVLYARGDGVDQDYGEALKWYRKAADQGDVYGQNNLGLMYMRGQGVKADDRLAASFYQQAADQRFAPAQFNLATMYAQGRGVPRDTIEAYKWAALATGNYAPEDADQREEAFKALDRLAARMTPGEIDEAESRAETWKPPARSPTK